MLPRLNEVDFGAPDANQEHSWSIESGKEPAYINAFVDEGIPVDEFRSGRKWIAIGLKGSGKTALLRHLSETMQGNAEYIIFRDDIAEERDIYTEAFLEQSPIILQGEEIHKCKHYKHVMKRLLACIVLKKMPTGSVETNFNGLGGSIINLLKKLFKSSNGEVVTEVFDSVANVAKSIQIDPSVLNEKGNVFDVRKILKRENDRILSLLVERARKNNFAANIFVDEVHFSFKNQLTFEADATLVRDLIDAASQLNARFRTENLNIQIYLGIRSEFLENPIISASEVNNIISSVAHRVSWATKPFNVFHPCMDVIRKRIFASMSSTSRPKSYRDVNIENVYFPNNPVDQFLKGVYGKPREAVRFFCIAKDMYGDQTSLSAAEFAAVFREYSNQSWGEIQTSLSSFLSTEGVLQLEDVLREIAVLTYDKRVRFDEVRPMLFNFWTSTGRNEGVSSFNLFLNMLYVLGIYFTSFQSERGMVYHAYYRGNFKPTHDGYFSLSHAVERRFR